MNAENFCYWLQGMFEVGMIKDLDENKISIILEHLKLVLNDVESVTTKQKEFCIWLSGFLEDLESSDSAKTSKIKSKLEKPFVKVTGSKNELNINIADFVRNSQRCFSRSMPIC